MSDKPKIYGTCAAGCLWETVHKEDIDNQTLVVNIANKLQHKEYETLYEEDGKVALRCGLISFLVTTYDGDDSVLDNATVIADVQCSSRSAVFQMKAWDLKNSTSYLATYRLSFSFIGGVSAFYVYLAELMDDNEYSIDSVNYAEIKYKYLSEFQPKG